MILALLVSLDPVAAPVAKAVGVAKETVIFWARTVFALLLGVWLVNSGIAAIALPILGVPLIVIGLALVAYAVWPLFGGGDKHPEK